ncbi:PEP-utilizing enzyme [Sphaerobacter thermophilus]|uniref:PEP-utilising protein mobile region n=1 Tax=Sphaerobacter thermophilus (strain ATCC 49802 / DSM 20745 / KCCM 41009 / NCIMB 13125 / S 6022) TaxID=479434 RepID=D1C8T7_SPHTD|nr:PEP-utilizing enzyme [Sphaerobacter thermophilus]ACZ40230.1 PEP-utilising protein mobile region [Sphaerobacter thermophilus DSM 20745]
MSGEIRFPSPFEVPTPAGAEGWQEMYPYYVLFSEDRRADEENRLWFYNGMHFPEPITPFDIITAEAAYVAIGEMSTRIFCIPPAKGIDFRVLNGYVYISPTPVTDPEAIQERAQLFEKRAGYYYANWRSIYDEWKQKLTREIEQLKAITFPDLPEVEDEKIVFERLGIGTSYDLLRSYHQAIESIYRVWQIHMEIIMIGFGAYFSFYDFCKRSFPEITDQQVTLMVGAIDVSMFRPNYELMRLARKALELGVADYFKPGASPQDVFAQLEQVEAGRAWLSEWEASADPWFYMNSGDGFQHHHRAWVDDPTPIFNVLPDYIARLQRGDRLERDVEALRQRRDEITEGYRNLLQTDADRQAFDQLIGLVRDVYYSMEDHKFYVEHWYMSIFWNKMRELGRVFVAHGFFEDEDDLFLLHYTEVYQALFDLLLGWSIGAPSRGPAYWPQLIARRKALMEQLRKWTPPPALGVVPETIGDPAVVMLWGITSDRLRAWLSPEDGSVLNGFAAAPGVAEGPARVVLSVEGLQHVQDGEILVCSVTEPSWAPIFTKVRATVADIGGVMSHAAIVAREYHIPAVLGTGNATKRIRTGQRIRVDGDSGTVTILDD